MKKYHIITFGCQANLADSEHIVKVLEKYGLSRAKDENSCDLLIFNTCSVRQKAEDRVFGLNNKFKKMKVAKKKLKIVLTGCMTHYSEKELQRRLPEIDFFVDSRKIDELPKLLKLKKTSMTGRRTSCHLKNTKYSALVPISYGCNNFCSYCIVPFARGRETSRNPKEIIKEVKEAISGGAKEIWLLGQNVNSYQFPDKNSSSVALAKEDSPIKFPELLRLVNAIPGDFWIRFTSPHPKDFSDEMIKAMAECEKSTHYLHLPVQAGNNTVLKRMNRPYTIEHYKKLIKKIRKSIPDIVITTDVIVGFSGETKQQFQDTVKLFKEVKFDMAFISEYSPRSKTLAAEKYKDDVSHEEKERRKKFLNDEALAKTGLEHNKKLLGQTIKVLAADKKDNVRTGGNKLVIVTGDYPIGEFFNVKITKAEPWKLRGEIV